MKESYKDLVASELRVLRAKHNYKQAEVAKMANLDISTISRYENNSCSMQLDVIEKIVNIYNLPLYIFFENISANMQNKIENIV